MSCTVFANGMGYFHKGSGGKGIAPADVCLSPPPPPAGPVPVPYVNNLMASDLILGSTTVKIEGQPTALEDSSQIALSTGDEAGTLGGNVVTHMIKGKGFFMLWSFDVKVEDKGVCRHGDMMGQNSASTPPGCVDASAIVEFLMSPMFSTEPCPEGSTPPRTKASPEQYKSVYDKECWECARDVAHGVATGPQVQKRKRKDPKKMTPDHQPPVSAAWYLGGCHMEPKPEAFNTWMTKNAVILPHCSNHTDIQGGTAKHFDSAKVRSWIPEVQSWMV